MRGQKNQNSLWVVLTEHSGPIVTMNAKAAMITVRHVSTVVPIVLLAQKEHTYLVLISVQVVELFGERICCFLQMETALKLVVMESIMGLMTVMMGIR